MRQRHAQPGGIPRFFEMPGKKRGVPVFTSKAVEFKLQTTFGLFLRKVGAGAGPMNRDADDEA